MLETIFLTTVVSWPVCGTLAYGLHFAHFQRRFPKTAQEEYWTDLFMSIVMGFFGPLGLVCVIQIMETEYGFKWK